MYAMDIYSQFFKDNPAAFNLKKNTGITLFHYHPQIQIINENKTVNI